MSSVRSGHRWTAVVFTLTVLANVVNVVVDGPTWVGYVAVAPLVALMLSGWYLLLAPSLRGGVPQRSR